MLQSARRRSPKHRDEWPWALVESKLTTVYRSIPMPDINTKPAELFLFIICYSVNIYFFMGTMKNSNSLHNDILKTLDLMVLPNNYSYS